MRCCRNGGVRVGVAPLERGSHCVVDSEGGEPEVERADWRWLEPFSVDGAEGDPLPVDDDLGVAVRIRPRGRCPCRRNQEAQQDQRNEQQCQISA